ncbi:MAG: metalloprotease TldD [Legionellales bacterium]|nr:metalloprotease TldD [Legionellales bacterium]
MSKNLDIAKRTLLEPAGISDQLLQKILGDILGPSIDNADLYFQSTRMESWVLEDGIVKDGSFSVERGVGVRAMSGEKTGFAYSDDILIPALEQSCKAAKSIAKQGQEGQLQAWRGTQGLDLYGMEDPLASMSEHDKIALLERLDKYARSLDPRVKQVFLSLGGTHEVVLVMASDGSIAADVRPLVRLSVNVITEQHGRREQGMMGGGGRMDYQYFVKDNLAQTYVDMAVREALLNLEAVDAPAGTMPVVLAPGWPGVLLHEAIGHGLEGDFNRKGTSAFSGRIGERVAAPGCTIVDDGTIASRRGSLNVDDEGTPTQCTTLIEDGILKNYMQDKLNARLMGMQPTGNGRRESYAHLPLPRMTNTYMLNGSYDHEEIIASVDKGLYAVNFAGGQVDITSGKFVFSASEAYLIENGKITTPVKGATLIGSGPDVLTKVSMVGNDLQLDSGIGTCGKDGQSVPVGVGQPTLKVDSLTVGGSS